MTEQNPIIPSPELVEQWEAETAHTTKDEIWHVAVQAAQWGADQELEACCEWVDWKWSGISSRDLRAARRPKPPSLKEQALDELDGIAAVFRMSHGGDLVCDKIRRALEALPND
jgi:hypothetical protein